MKTRALVRGSRRVILETLSCSRAASAPSHSQGAAASYCQKAPGPVDVEHLQPGGTHGYLLTFPSGTEKDVSCPRVGWRHPLSNQSKRR